MRTRRRKLKRWVKILLLNMLLMINIFIAIYKGISLESMLLLVNSLYINYVMEKEEESY